MAEGLVDSAFSGAEAAAGENILLALDDQGALCPAFDRAANRCRHYGLRPLDCQLYPLLLMFDEEGANVLLGADPACPAVERLMNTDALSRCVGEAARMLDWEWLEAAFASRSAIGEFKPWLEETVPLPGLSRRVCRSDLGLKRLTLRACEALAPLAGAAPVRLAAQSLPAVRAWAGPLDLFWAVEGEKAILVAGGDGPGFLICPPLGAEQAEAAIKRSVEILRAMNPPHIPPRIQEVDDAAWPEYEALGFRTDQTFTEYIYERDALVALAGKAYKGKRSARNHFEKNFAPAYRPYEAKDLPACMALYRKWRAKREASHPDELYRLQIRASAAMLHRALREDEPLGMRARVVESGGRVVGCTVGFPVPGGEQFAVLAEVADPRCKGAAAWLYQRFCAEAEGFALINAMTDSGLPSLAKAKELYRPTRKEVARGGVLEGGRGGLCQITA